MTAHQFSKINRASCPSPHRVRRWFYLKLEEKDIGGVSCPSHVAVCFPHTGLQQNRYFSGLFLIFLWTLFGVCWETACRSMWTSPIPMQPLIPGFTLSHQATFGFHQLSPILEHSSHQCLVMSSPGECTFFSLTSLCSHGLSLDLGPVTSALVVQEKPYNLKLIWLFFIISIEAALLSTL